MNCWRAVRRSRRRVPWPRLRRRLGGSAVGATARGASAGGDAGADAEKRMRAVVVVVDEAADAQRAAQARPAPQRPPPPALTVSSAQRRPRLRGDEQLVLRVRGTAVNRADLLQRRGLYPPPAGASPIMGLEAYGEVVESSSPKWRCGDEAVALLQGGGYGEFALANAGCAIPLSDAFPGEFLTFSHRAGRFERRTDRAAAASGLAEVWLTAFQLLCHDAMLGAARAGETVLIHAGAGGVGLAAVQIARDMRLRALVTAGTEAKVAACRELGAADGWVYRGKPVEALAEFVGSAETGGGGGGVDIVLDCIGKPYAPVHARMLRRGGRWVVYGLLGGRRADGVDLSALLARDARIVGTTLRGRALAYRSALVERFARYAMPRFADGTFAPVVDCTHPRVFSLHDTERAHAHVESSNAIGKVVMRGFADGG